MGWASKFENELERQFGYIETAVRNASAKIGVDLTDDLIKRIQRAAADTQTFAFQYLNQLPYGLKELEERIDWLRFEHDVDDDENKSEINSLRRQVAGFQAALSTVRDELDATRKQRDALKSELGKRAIRLPREYRELETLLRKPTAGAS